MSDYIENDEIENKKEADSKDDGYEDICYICHRTESTAGKMVHLPNNICVCPDCMQRTFDSMNNGNIDYENLMQNMSYMPNISMINLSDLNNMNPNVKPKSQKIKIGRA